MYENFYRLKEKPFALTPDSQLVFPSKQHTEAMEYLRYGIVEKKGFILITGEAGTGKTTLCRTFLKSMGDKIEVALVLNSFLTEIELLRAINRDFGIDPRGETREQLVSALNKFLIQQREKGKTVVVIVDESQNLQPAVLEQIRMLSNLETEKEKLLQIVLVGQPELETTLAAQELRQLNQRITVRYHIEPLNFYEAQKYVYYRIQAVGDAENPLRFTRGAMKKIHRLSRGNPRSINVLCDYALLTGYAHETFTIDRSLVKKAARELRWRHRTQPLRIKWNWQTPVAAVAAACAAAALFSAGRTEGPAAPQNAPPVLPVVDVKLPLALAPIAPAAAEPTELLVFKNADEALWELAGMWDTAKQLPQKATHSQTKLALLKEFGFQQAETWADLQVLAKINFPCVLEVRFPKDREDSFMILSAMRGQEASFLAKAGRTETLSVKDLEKIWHGKAVLLYRDPDGGSYSEVFVEKMKGPGIELLQKRLFSLGYLPNGVSGVFDAATREAIQTFQKDMGFTADGVASVETQLALFHLNRQEGAPFLVQAETPTKPAATVLTLENENQ